MASKSRIRSSPDGTATRNESYLVCDICGQEVEWLSCGVCVLCGNAERTQDISFKRDRTKEPTDER